MAEPLLGTAIADISMGAAVEIQIDPKTGVIRVMPAMLTAKLQEPTAAPDPGVPGWDYGPTASDKALDRALESMRTTETFVCICTPADGEYLAIRDSCSIHGKDPQADPAVCSCGWREGFGGWPIRHQVATCRVHCPRACSDCGRMCIKTGGGPWACIPRPASASNPNGPDPAIGGSLEYVLFQARASHQNVREASLTDRCEEFLRAELADLARWRSASRPNLDPPWTLYTDKGKPVAVMPSGRPGDVCSVVGWSLEDAQRLIDAANRASRPTGANLYALTCESCGVLSPIVADEDAVDDAATNDGWFAEGHNDDPGTQCPACQSLGNGLTPRSGSASTGVTIPDATYCLLLGAIEGALDQERGGVGAAWWRPLSDAYDALPDEPEASPCASQEQEGSCGNASSVDGGAATTGITSACTDGSTTAASDAVPSSSTTTGHSASPDAPRRASAICNDPKHRMSVEFTNVLHGSKTVKLYVDGELVHACVHDPWTDSRPHADEILYARVEVVDAICTWFHDNGYPRPAEVLHRERLRFFKTPEPAIPEGVLAARLKHNAMRTVPLPTDLAERLYSTGAPYSHRALTHDAYERGVLDGKKP